MLVVEQTAVIEASMAVVMQALNDVENFPTWTTVKGVIDNVQGNGRGIQCYSPGDNKQKDDMYQDKTGPSEGSPFLKVKHRNR